MCVSGRSIGVSQVTDSSYVGQGWELGLPTDSCIEGACYRLFQSAYCHGVSARAAAASVFLLSV